MKALVAFGTKYGSTVKVAEEISSVLKTLGADVTVHDLRQKRVGPLEQYDLVIVGSAILVGAWTKEAQRFLEENSEVLSKKKVALFACCGDMVFQRSSMEECRKNYLENVADKYGIKSPASMALFGGVLDFSKYGFLVKAILSSSKKEFEQKGIDMSKPYDFRNWEEIRSWAGSLIDRS